MVCTKWRMTDVSEAKAFAIMLKLDRTRISSIFIFIIPREIHFVAAIHDSLGININCNRIRSKNIDERLEGNRAPVCKGKISLNSE